MSHFEYASFYKISKHKNTVFDISIHYIHLLIQIFLKKIYLAIFPIVSSWSQAQGEFHCSPMILILLCSVLFISLAKTEGMMRHTTVASRAHPVDGNV